MQATSMMTFGDPERAGPASVPSAHGERGRPKRGQDADEATARGRPSQRGQDADEGGPRGRPKRSEEDADDLDAVWRALSNGTRRKMLDLLKDGPLTTGDLAGRFADLSRFAVMQHLRVLEEADLVVPVRDGRLRYNYLNPVPIQSIYDRWVSEYMQPWTDALTSLKRELEGRAGRRA
jgi:DNA-binding transcriptional ArsR family regulator